MATPGGTIQATFGVNVAPFQQGMAQAQATAATTAKNITQSLASVSQQFGGPAARAGSHGGGQFGGRAAGDLINMLTGSSGSVSMINSLNHLVGGAAVATGIVALEKVTSAWGEALGAAIKYRQEMDAIKQSSSIGSSEFQSISALTSKLDELATKRQALVSARAGETDEPFTAAGLRRQIRRGIGSLSGKGTYDEQGKQELEDLNTLRDAAGKKIEQIAQKQQKLNDVERENTSGSENKAALLKLEIDHKERLGALAEAEKATGDDNNAALEAENKRYDLAVESQNKKNQKLNEELSLREKIAAINSDPLSSNDDKRLAALKAQETSASTREFNAGSNEEKRAAHVDTVNASTALDNEEFRQFQDRSSPDYYRNQIKDQSERRNFEANKADYLDRQRRGAHDQTGPLADILGKKTDPESGPGADNIKGKLDTLITTLNNLPAKIGIA